MRQQQDELERLRVDVAVVTFERPETARAYVQETDLDWPLLLDHDRDLFTAYGMHRGTRWEVFGPASWWIYIKLLLRGRRLRQPTGDVHQLGGDVLIDPDSVVRLHHVGHGPADRPAVRSLLAVVRDRSGPPEPSQD